jgi:hypothetical protein
MRSIAAIYVGLFGHDSGFEDGQGLSSTEHEFRRATEKHKLRLISSKAPMTKVGIRKCRSSFATPAADSSADASLAYPHRLPQALSTAKAWPLYRQFRSEFPALDDQLSSLSPKPSSKTRSAGLPYSAGLEHIRSGRFLPRFRSDGTVKRFT